jgi:two-component system NtrC family sensor kinase
LERIKRVRQLALEVPIIVVVDSQSHNVHTLSRLLTRAMKLGIQGVLALPLDPDEVQQTVQEVIQGYQGDVRNRWHRIQQIVQTEKLATAGRIVASIAHEMNNPLQALHNALHLLGKRSFNGRKRHQYLHMAQEEVGNLIHIVRRMLDLYRPSNEGMRLTDMNALLETTLHRVDKELHNSNVRVLREWYPRLPNVFAIGSRLKQVCADLITNAIQAMPQGGTLTIRTYATNGTEYQVNAGVEILPTGTAGHQIKGPSVVVEISDTGTGIAPEALTRIFEPFYTTRFHATGLGLAISYSIVEQHQGELSVSSSEGKGTTVRLRLPAAT